MSYAQINRRKTRPKESKKIEKMEQKQKIDDFMKSMYIIYCLYNSPLVSMFTTKNPLLKLTASSMRTLYVVSSFKWKLKLF